MPAPKMSGTELIGRVIAIEACVTAFAAERIAELDADKANAILAGVKPLAQALVDHLASSGVGPAPPMIKEIEKSAEVYAEQFLDSISRTAGSLKKAAAPAAIAAQK